MGANTYEWVRRNSELVEAEVGSPWPYTQPTWVMTTRELPLIEGADVRFARGDVSPVHAAIAKLIGSKNLWVVGGGELAGQFYDAGLLDELILQVGSVTLGKGKPVFPREVLSPQLRLKAVRQMGATMVELRYDVVRGLSAGN